LLDLRTYFFRLSGLKGLFLLKDEEESEDLTKRQIALCHENLEKKDYLKLDLLNKACY